MDVEDDVGEAAQADMDDDDEPTEVQRILTQDTPGSRARMNELLDDRAEQHLARLAEMEDINSSVNVAGFEILEVEDRALSSDPETPWYLPMTPRERTFPKLINGSRRKRIAAGSGTSVQEVNKILKQQQQMQGKNKTKKDTAIIIKIKAATLNH